MEVNLVELWLRKDPIRWIAGAAAGLLAGLVAMLFAVLLAALGGFEAWYPLKVPALPFLGMEALRIGPHFDAIFLGLFAFLLLALFLGIVYAHFSAVNYLPALLGVGVTWGLFSWIFIVNLFMPSFRAYSSAQVSSGAAFFVCVVFGITLTSVAFFDRAFRGKAAVKASIA
jgi:hypothetical protein